MQVPVKKEVHPREKFSDCLVEVSQVNSAGSSRKGSPKEKCGECPVEVPQVQIIDEIVHVPVKKEVHAQVIPKEEFGGCPIEVPQSLCDGSR